MCLINLKEIILIIIVAHCIETYDCLQHASCEIGARKHSSRCCISGSFGTQCTAIALIALIFASFKVEINTWAPQHLDTIIFEGDTLYGRFINERFNGDTSRYLSHNIYIFIAIALDESIFLDVLHFPMKNIKSRGLEATPMGGLTSKLIQ